MICNNCGTNNPDKVKSCCNCGQDLEVQHMPNVDTHKRHKILKILTITLASILGGIVCLVSLISLPWILIGLGIALSPSPPAPKITHGEFPFHLVYEVDGNKYTIDDTIICDYVGTYADEGHGKYIEWKENLANGNEITRFSFTGDEKYGIKLFDGAVQGKGSKTIICDIGNPQYYLGYNKYADYCPGRIGTGCLKMGQSVKMNCGINTR